MLIWCSVQYDCISIDKLLTSGDFTKLYFYAYVQCTIHNSCIRKGVLKFTQHLHSSFTKIVKQKESTKIMFYT